MMGGEGGAADPQIPTIHVSGVGAGGSGPGEQTVDPGQGDCLYPASLAWIFCFALERP